MTSREVGEGEKILPCVVVEQFTGAFAPMTPGSTKPVAEVRRHAGIAKVRCYTSTLA